MITCDCSTAIRPKPRQGACLNIRKDKSWQSLINLKVFIADITKAKKLLNWQPNISTNYGIELMLEWLSD